MARSAKLRPPDADQSQVKAPLDQVTAAPSRLVVEYRPVSSLIPYALNARTHDSRQLAQIAASMAAFGWTNPVLIEPDGSIIAGHGRVLAAEREWLAGRSIARCPDGEVPCLLVEGLSAAEKAALVLADNKIAANAGWDDALLRSELQAIDLSGLDAVLTGFDGPELADLLAVPVPRGADPDAAPPVEVVVVSRLGDVWVLGEHRLACGDCTDAVVVRALLGSDRPRLMVTDPPYGVNYDPGWRNAATRPDGKALAATRAVGKVLNDDRADWRAAWALFPGTVAYVWHAGLHGDQVAESLRAVRLMPRAQIVWVKSRLVISRGDYHAQHEPALYAVREGAADAWQGAAADSPDARFAAEHEAALYAVREGATGGYVGGRKQSTVWSIEHLRSDSGHGTQKPVEAMARPMRNNSQPHDLVYEPFSGSGTSIIAAEVLGRRCRAIELSAAYVDVAIRRWEAYTQRRASLERQAAGPVGPVVTFAAVAARRAREAAR